MTKNSADVSSYYTSIRKVETGCAQLFEEAIGEYQMYKTKIIKTSDLYAVIAFCCSLLPIISSCGGDPITNVTDRRHCRDQATEKYNGAYPRSTAA